MADLYMSLRATFVYEQRSIAYQTDLTHCDVVTPYGDQDLSQKWLR